MTYPIHSIETDMGGRFYARVCIAPDQAVFLKFLEYPSEAAIQEAATAYVAMMQAEAESDGATE
jgi:hypothetical protein